MGHLSMSPIETVLFPLSARQPHNTWSHTHPPPEDSKEKPRCRSRREKASIAPPAAHRPQPAPLCTPPVAALVQLLRRAHPYPRRTPCSSPHPSLPPPPRAAAAVLAPRVPAVAGEEN
ncbi:hypothetical protein GQ55_4G372000 [Panicum hallii var. hallii]|uniref:Uncharacterized protein n=1 Tax=Panicum hallii var. hallii TaxID=1504633 RepID=A0A2T7E466_9POAL|nr:hypothetical protein GQ55_4G372000 [Panicum hallii var. hallii]